MSNTSLQASYVFYVTGTPGSPEPTGGDRSGATDSAASKSLVPGLGGVVSASIVVSARRGASAPQRIEAVPGRDVLVLQLADGPALVLHPESAQRLMQAQAPVTRDGPPPDGQTIPLELQWHSLDALTGGTEAAASRGWVRSVIVRAVQLVTGAQVEAVASKAAAQVIAAKVDEQVTAGVYRLSAEPFTQSLKAQDATPFHELEPLPDGAPKLVLIHGTFSNTQGTFQHLWQQPSSLVQQLFNHYQGEVYGLDHPTLGASPIENALTLVKALPEHTRLHLLTHSRGGLVAEVLARACEYDDAEAESIELFDDVPDQQAMLRELIATVRQQRIQVERIVRVACPVRGTLLASKRLDAYVSLLRWALQTAGLPVLSGVVEFLGAVAKQRTDPTLLPGLAAQIPDSALIQWIHAADQPLKSELRVIAGDLTGDSLVAWLKTFASDVFFRTDNDLVVQTSSMYGGALRDAGASFVLDVGGKVSHFRYFANERTARAVHGALIGKPSDEFKPIGPQSWQGNATDGLRGGTDDAPQPDRPAVILLPGITGSHLAVDRKRIWLGWRLLNGLTKLEYRQGERQQDGTWSRVPDDVEPDGPIGNYYDDLIAHLGRTHEVIRFAFDWRLPIENEARRLSVVLDEALRQRERSGKPVRILAHSMGGLVARTVAIRHRAVWDRMMAHPEARFLMLGTPNGGSWAPMQALSGDDRSINAVLAFGAPFQDHRARTLMAGFPGLLQMQAELLNPVYGLDRAETWQRLAGADKAALDQRNFWHREDGTTTVYDWGLPSQQTLDQAKAFRQMLDAQVQDRDGWTRIAAKMLLVVGKAKFTPDSFRCGPPDGLVYLDTPRPGDGRVTLDRAVLPSVRTWTVDCAHGDLPNHGDSFTAYEDLLLRGSTDRLQTLEQAGWLGDGQRGGSSGGEPILVPSRPGREWRNARQPLSAEALRNGAPGSEDDAPREGVQALRITVLNGNLKFVSQPLMVGHYQSLRLAGAEWIISQQTGGTMAQALSLRRYPDLPGSVQVFENLKTSGQDPYQLPRPDAAIVIGLGPEGKLRSSELVYSVRQGVLAWAQKLLERSVAPPPVFALSATLIGSGGTLFSTGQSAQCIALGVHEANQCLAELGDAGPQRWPRCGSLQLIELYLDRATEAWRALRLQAQAMPARFALDPVIQQGPGALRRPIDAGYRGADYDIICAVFGRDDRGRSQITYTLDTRRARSEVREQQTQGRLLRELVATASNEAKSDAQIGRTLFNLLIPIELEPFLGGSTELVMEVDAEAAAIPWELLDTQRDDGPRESTDEPWAIRSKLLRKLRTVDFRDRPVDASADECALIVGEPDTTTLARTLGGRRVRYARLPGARKEAQAVSACLAAPGAIGADRVLSLISSDDDSRMIDAATIIKALMAKRWRIVHLAGHGEPPETVDDLSETDRAACRAPRPRGVVLSNGTFIGPDEIRSMRVVPELVFVNCCHLAGVSASRLPDETEPQRHDKAQFAATVAESLIMIGVRCVVAAGWAVDDGAASAFATTFYQSLLQGRRFIDAVADARRTAYGKGGNTWAAYQCYGDPDWTFRRASADAGSRPVPPSDQFAGIASPLALANALETLAISADFEGSDDAAQDRRRAALTAQLRYLDASFAERWGHMGAVAEAFGLAWSVAGDPLEAIRWYECAVRSNDGSASMRAAEQLGNARARQAERTIEQLAGELQTPKTAASSTESEAGGAPQKKGLTLSPEQRRRWASAQADLAQALHDLHLLVTLQPTPERWSLLGSAWKRRALGLRLGRLTLAPDAPLHLQPLVDATDVPQVPTVDSMLEPPVAADGDAARAEALDRMGKAYQQGVVLARAGGSDDLFYPALNEVAARVVQRKNDPVVLDAEWEALDAQLREINTTRPSFWSLVAATELRLYRALDKQELDDGQVAMLLGEWTTLHQRVASPRQWDSVRKQLQFLAAHCTLTADGQRVLASLMTQLDALIEPKTADPAGDRRRRA